MKVIELIGRVLRPRRAPVAIRSLRKDPPSRWEAGPAHSDFDLLDQLPLHYAECYLGRSELRSVLEDTTPPPRPAARGRRDGPTRMTNPTEPLRKPA